MDIQLDQNPFKTLLIASLDTIRIYVYYKTASKGIYKFFYSADKGLGSIDVDLSKVNMKDTETFMNNETIPSFIDFTYIDGEQSGPKFRLEFLNSLTAKLVEKLKIVPEVKEEPSWKIKYEEAQRLNNRLLEIIDKKINE